MTPRTARRTLARRTFAVLAATSLAAAVLLSLAPSPPADACGPWFPSAAFWPTGSTGVPWPRLVDGELGILDAGVDPRELWIAYRHLAGPPLSDADRAALATLGKPDGGDYGWSDPQIWTSARDRVPGAEAVGYLDVVRFEQRPGDDGNVVYLNILNCLGDAFATAAATLDARIASYGATSPEVAEWLRGQDAVFANCSAGQTLPEPLDAAWPAELRRDRDYQIAAAHFYSLDYAEAEHRFRRIGDDDASPWQQTARYLVARTQARDGRWQAAVATLRGLLADPAQAPFHDSIRGLIDHYRFHSAPGELHAEKRAAVLAEPLPANVDQNWIDFQRTLVSADGDADFDRWLAAFGRRDDDGEESGEMDDEGMDEAAYDDGATTMTTDAVAVWRAAPSRHWLVAALVAASGRQTAEGERFEDLLAAAAVVDPAAPEALTVEFHRARLLFAVGRDGEAAALLDRRLADADALPLASRNRLSVLRAAHAADLASYLRRSQLVPSGLSIDDMFMAPIDDQPLPLLLTAGAVDLVNRLSLDELATLVEGEVLATGPRRRVANAAWTRAVLLDDDATARRLAPLLARLSPELAPAIERYRQAGDDERRFVAVLILLRHPGLGPEVLPDLPRDEPLAELDPYRQNWWCPQPGEYVVEDESAARPPFFSLDGAHSAQRAEERRALAARPGGPVFLGDLAIDWADAHRDDPRVPEALHLVVRATRFGCTWGFDEDVGAVSRDAFTRLHRRYPKSPWTQRTPYWFE